MKPHTESSNPPWHMGRLMDLATGYWKSAVLSAAVQLNLFDALEEHTHPRPLQGGEKESTKNRARIPSRKGSGHPSEAHGDRGVGPLPGTCAIDIAERLDVSAEYVAELLDALTALELLVKTGDTYVLHPGARALLSRTSPSCILDALRFNIDLYPLWGRLADCIRNGQPVVPPGAHLGGDPERTRRFVMGMHSRALGMAPAILPRLDLSGAETVLDVASGPGTFSRLLAEQHPRLRVTQSDLPPVLDVARELTRESPAADRIEFRPADYRKDALPHDFDAVLLIGAIHQEDPDSAEPLFVSIRKSLKSGGTFYLVDMMLNEERTGPLFSNLFSLNMRLTSPRGRVFSGAELTRLLDRAGFAEIECDRHEHSPYWIIRARRS